MNKLLESCRDAAPLVLRVAGGVIFAAHGAQKVFGGMEQFGSVISTLGLPSYFVYVGAFVELVGGILLIVGLLVRLAAFLLAGQMAVAIVTFHWLHLKQGLVGGFEFPLAMMAMMLALFFLGSGKLSLDRRWFGWR